MDNEQRENYKKHISHDVAIEFIEALLKEVVNWSLADVIYAREWTSPEDRLYTVLHDLKFYKNQSKEYNELKTLLKKMVK